MPTLTQLCCRVTLVALLQSLRNLEEARVTWPSLEEQVLWAAKEPILDRRWGFIDGKNYPAQSPSDPLMQNAMYNGWLYCVFLTGVLCFGVDGCVVWGKHNFVGSWSDGEMSRELQDQLRRDDNNAPNHGLLSDTAFPVADGHLGRIMTP